MFAIILIVVLMIAALGIGIFWLIDGEPLIAAGTVIVGAVLSVAIWAFASMTIVEAKNVGVVTSYGKPAGTLKPGFHWKKPWQKVTDIDGTIQTDEYKGNRCIYVRIGDGSRSCLTATIRWRVNADNADKVYGDYRSNNPTDTLRDAVVSTQFKSASQAVLSKYNPVAGLQVVEGKNAAQAANLNFAPDYDAIAKDLTTQMEQRLGGNPLVEVQSITVSYLSLADSTQKKLNDFIAAVGDTRIASQRKSTASEEADANRLLSGSVSHDPNVLVSKCLDVLKEAVEKGYTLPAGFTCWPGGSGLVVSGR